MSTKRPKELKQNTRNYSQEFKGTTHITPVGGNIFRDLGFSPEDAEAMLREAKRRLAERKAKET